MITNINLYLSVSTDQIPSAPEIYYIGLHDRERIEYGYKSRDPNDDVPEVVKLGNGEAYSLVEPVEWLWYWSWARRHPSFVASGESLTYWRSKMRDNGAFTNKFGSFTKRSFILGTNITAEPMRSEGVTCPGENIFRIADPKTVYVNGKESLKIWCLDYDYLTTLTISQAKTLAVALPRWLWHTAWDVHPDGSTSPWDYNFGTPLFSNSGKTAIIDGFHCKINTIRTSAIIPYSE